MVVIGKTRQTAPHQCLPTITKMVTLAIHTMMRWLFWSAEKSILEYEQRVSGLLKDAEAVIESLASNTWKRS